MCRARQIHRTALQRRTTVLLKRRGGAPRSTTSCPRRVEVRDGVHDASLGRRAGQLRANCCRRATTANSRRPGDNPRRWPPRLNWSRRSHCCHPTLGEPHALPSATRPRTISAGKRFVRPSLEPLEIRLAMSSAAPAAAGVVNADAIVVEPDLQPGPTATFATALDRARRQCGLKRRHRRFGWLFTTTDPIGLRYQRHRIWLDRGKRCRPNHRHRRRLRRPRSDR